MESRPEPSGAGGPVKGSYAQELDRGLRSLRAVVLAVASVGPAGSVFAFVPIVFFIGGTFAFYAFVIAFLLALCEGLAYAELGSAYPIAGGEYAMVGRVLGRPTGAFLFAIMVAEYIFVPSAFALVAGLYLGVMWPWAGAHLHVVGVACLAWAVGVALLRVKLGAWVAGFFLAIQIVAVGALTILGLINAHNPADRLFTATAYGPDGPISLTLSAALLATTIAFFTYQGFGNAIIFSEETKGAKKKIGGVVMWAVVVTGLAILVPTTAVLLGAPSVEGLLTSASPMTYMIEATGGKTFDTILSFVIFLALLDAITASMMAFTRVIYSSGRDNAWPTPVSKALAYIHPRYKTPWGAVVALGITAIVLTALSTIAMVVTWLGVITLVYAFLLGLSAIVMRLKKSPPERYKMPLWPVPALVLVGACIVMVTSQTLKDVLIVVSIGAAFLLYYLVYLLPRSATHWVFLEAVAEDETADNNTHVDGPTTMI